MLAIKERTAYELALEMQHCFEFFWPRADARVYEDVKRLADLGLVASSKEYVGRRPRTTYTITEEGRRTLAGWLAAPPRPVALEFEALVKVYLARFGSREQLLATLEQTRADAAYMLRVANTVRQVYLERCAPFQDDYVHIWQFVYDFLVDYFRLLHGWAQRSEQTVKAWPDLAPDGKREQALARFKGKRPGGPASVAPREDAPEESVEPLPGMWRRRHELRQATAVLHREQTEEQPQES